MIRIPRHHIEERAKVRPEGYFDDVASAGYWSSDGAELVLEESEWQRLVEKYQHAEPKRPGLFEMLGNFADAIGEWAAAGFPVASKDEFKRRIQICHGCPAWIPGAIPHCSACGCSTNLKPWLATERCPKGLW